MANLYENELTICGDSVAVDVIKGSIINKEGEIDLGILLPELEPSTQWRYNNWGTKYIEGCGGFGLNISEYEPKDGCKNLTIFFNSANGAPTQWFKELCRIFGDKQMELSLTYADPGCMVGAWLSNDDDGGFIVNSMEDCDIIDFCGLEEDVW